YSGTGRGRLARYGANRRPRTASETLIEAPRTRVASRRWRHATPAGPAPQGNEIDPGRRRAGAHTGCSTSPRSLATLYPDGRRIWRSPVGIGRPGMETPAGHLYVRVRLPGFGATPGPVVFWMSRPVRGERWSAD